MRSVIKYNNHGATLEALLYIIDAINNSLEKKEKKKKKFSLHERLPHFL